MFVLIFKVFSIADEFDCIVEQLELFFGDLIFTVEEFDALLHLEYVVIAKVALRT